MTFMQWLGWHWHCSQGLKFLVLLIVLFGAPTLVAGLVANFAPKFFWTLYLGPALAPLGFLFLAWSKRAEIRARIQGEK